MNISHIVVTAPHGSVAAAYRRRLSVLKESVDWLKRCHVLCISDPGGKRIGSGGGTLNAINAVVNSCGASLVDYKIVIIHSGGDSQRSPLHSVCGKAWATINSTPSCDCHDEAQGEYSTAFSLILNQLNLIARTMHPNSIIVSCSDVILDLSMLGDDLNRRRDAIPMDCVCTVGIPEVLSVAKNHGCLYTKDPDDMSRPASGGNDEQEAYVRPVHQYYQKPSPEQLQHCLYEPDGGEVHSSAGVGADGGALRALIDSGITIFHGEAAQSLFRLLDDLNALHSPADGSSRCDSEYPCCTRLELYSDMLFACSRGATREVEEVEGGVSGDFESRFLVYVTAMIGDSGAADPLVLAVFRRLYARLHGIPFNAIIVPRGSFGHLGTSMEWLQLVGSTGFTPSGIGDLNDSFGEKCLVFSKIYKLESKVHCCLLTSSSGGNGHTRLCVVNSLLGSRERAAEVGAPHPVCKLCSSGASGACLGSVHSLVEHSVLTGETCIGAHCIVSHVLSAGDQAPAASRLGHNLTLLDHMMLQTVPVEPPDPNLADCCLIAGSAPRAVLLLGLLDNVKLDFREPGATYCNIAWSTIFALLGEVVGPGDIWRADGADNMEPRTLWNAELFVVVGTSTSTSCADAREGSSLLWWQDVQIVADGALSTPEKLQAFRAAADAWKTLPRISLKRILQLGLADSMFEWSHFLSKIITEMDTAAAAGGSFISVLPQLHHVSDSENATRTGIMRCYYTGMERCFVELCTCFCLIRVYWGQHKSRVHHTTGEASLWEAPLGRGIGLLAVWWCGLCERECSTDFVVKLADGMCNAVLGRSSNAGECGSSGSTVVVREAQDLFGSLYGACEHLDPALVLFSVLHHLPRMQALRLLPLLLQISGEAAMAEKCAIVIERQPRVLLLLSVFCQHFHIHVDPLDVERILSSFNNCLNKTIDGHGVAAWGDLGWRVSSFFADTGVKIRELLSEQHADSCAGASTLAAVSLGGVFEACAQKLVTLHVDLSLGQLYPDIGQMVLPRLGGMALPTGFSEARSPLRIDLMGGWSDTPPICYELGGAVVNLGVTVAGRRPLSARCRLFPTPEGKTPEIRLTSLRVSSTSDGTYASESVSCHSYSELVAHMDDPQSNQCVLLKAVVLVALGLPVPGSEVECLLPEVFHIFGGCSLELVSETSLPSGSGLGGSSVLAATALRAVEHLLSRAGVAKEAEDWGLGGEREWGARLRLSAQVSKVEQIMTTGGGWQDQIGAIFPGLKLGVCEHGLPLNVDVIPLSFDNEALASQFHRVLESRLFLVYTGRQRLARNCLINALKRNAATPYRTGIGDGSANTISTLAEGARALMHRLQKRASSLQEATAVAIINELNEMVDDIAATLSCYWEGKRLMAGGSEPHFVSDLFHAVHPVCSGFSLCGAGGGGFATVILAQGRCKDELVSSLLPLKGVSDEGRSELKQFEMFSVLDIEVDTFGIIVEILNS